MMEIHIQVSTENFFGSLISSRLDSVLLRFLPKDGNGIFFYDLQKYITHTLYFGLNDAMNSLVHVSK
jgi:hypothetical protein